MLERKKFYQYLFGFSLLAVAISACAGIPLANYAPTPTPTPDIAMINEERLSNAYLSNFDNVNKALLASAEAFNYEQLLNEGFSKKAIDSAVQIQFRDGSTGASGSASMMYYVDEAGLSYWIAIQSGHGVKLLDEMDPKTINVDLIRNQKLPSSGMITLQNNDFGYAYDYVDGGIPDIGIIAIPTDVLIANAIPTMFRPENVIQTNDILFTDPDPHTTFSTVCMPGVTNYSPIAISGGIVQPFESSYNGLNIDNMTASLSCSGGGVYTSNNSYIGPIASGFETTDLVYLDNTVVSPINKIGKNGFNELIKKAIANQRAK